MKFRLGGSRARALATALLFLAFGICLFIYSYSLRAYDEERLIYDLIWLDAWSLSFLAAVVLLWRADVSRRLRTTCLFTVLGTYGVVFVALMFDGTVFGFNAYWGDQQFRIAQVLHYAAFGWNTDFFYRNLPPFYPPVYYFLLGIYAKLFSVEAYKMMKVGLMLLSVLAPVGVYFLWKKLVSPFQALVIAFVAALLTTTGIPFIFWGAHEYVGNMIFFPWWLYFIERVKTPPANIRFYVVGGLLGAVIFSTYFYAFFIAGLLILLRVTVFRNWSFLRGSTGFRLPSALGVIGLAAVFSAPYWLPLFISIGEFGMDRSRGGWHHIGSPGLNFDYTAFSWTGILFLAGLAYSARRFRAPLHRALLILVGSVSLFFLIGSIFGAMDMSLNLVKSRDFVSLAAIPVSGLFLAAVLRWGGLRAGRRYAVATVVIALLTFTLTQTDSTLKNKMVQIARTDAMPNWGIDADEMQAARGKVFLTSEMQVCSFYPVYSFIVNNEHYSHPASRFKQRYDLLNQLQLAPDPYLFYLGLRYNIFDPVDYFMPAEKDGRFQLPVSLSNYPSRWTTRYLTYPKSVVADTSLFMKRPGQNLFRLAESNPSGRVRPVNPAFVSPVDSVIYLDRARHISSYLTPEGQALLRRYVGCDFSNFQPLPLPPRGHVFADSIAMIGIDAVPVGDSTLLVLFLEARENVAGTYRIMLHFVADDGKPVNLDFVPQTPTNSWQKWQIAYCFRMVPRMTQNTIFDLTFFNSDTKLGPIYRGGLPRTP